MIKSRPYKESSPKRTVVKIQNILEKIDILALPTYWANPYPEIYSLRLQAIDEDGSFGANGKGRTQSFALASAYAEYIERLQNQLISGASGFGTHMLAKLHDLYGFYYYPDEKPLSQEAFYSLPDNVLADIFGENKNHHLRKEFADIFSRSNIKAKGGIISEPFYDVTNNQIIYLPKNVLLTYTGSNGMAAGNTIAEATFQAMCEIYERQAATLVYHNHLTPPTIFKEQLTEYPEELKIIHEIENNGFEVIVKDFSCNQKLPVIGLIIIHRKSKKYRLNLGADTSLRVALSRTLTEIHQGIRSLEDFNRILMDIPSKETHPFLFGYSNNAENEMNLAKFMKNGLGVFPPSIFESEFSYQHDPNTFNSKLSYEEEVKCLFSTARQNGYDIYIRDVSYLGFPTVFIYIPQVSIIGRKNAIINETTSAYVNKYDELEDLLLPFKKVLSNNQLRKRMISSFEEMISYSGIKLLMREILHIDFHTDNAWESMSVKYFLCLLYYLNNEYEKLCDCFDSYINEENLQDNSYYQECQKYFTKLAKREPISDISSEIIEDFKSADTLFQHIKYPNCPNCSNCKLSAFCKTQYLFKKALKINDEFKNHIINQNKFQIFSCY